MPADGTQGRVIYLGRCSVELAQFLAQYRSAYRCSVHDDCKADKKSRCLLAVPYAPMPGQRSVYIVGIVELRVAKKEQLGFGFAVKFWCVPLSLFSSMSLVSLKLFKLKEV